VFAKFLKRQTPHCEENYEDNYNISVNILKIKLFFKKI
jgi:hypothetical protein